jgi:nicotinate-nucleotide adenylyltransferase
VKTSGVKRTAIFGGSFNPVHVGHLLMADEMLERLDLDRVVFVPAAAPPHKPATSLAAAEHRYEMVRLAIAGHPRFEASDIELRRRGPSFTVDTLEALARPGEELFLLVGSETFLDLLSWRQPRRIVELARVVVVPRTGSTFDPESVAAQKVLREIGAERFVAPTDVITPRTVVVAHITSLPISASDLRARARQGRSLAYRTPDVVIAYIARHRLYAGETA